MPWTLGGIRIYVQELGREEEQIIPRLQPLNGGTVHQIYGYQDPIISLAGIVVGSGDCLTLHSFTTSGTMFTLSSPEGILGDYYVKSVKDSRSPYPFQFIRRDLDCMTPVFDLDVTLYKD